MNRPAAVKRVKVLPKSPARPNDSNKGTFGKTLIVAGHPGMSGAACLSGLGALRGGAGLVTVAVPRSILAIVAGVEPSYLTLPLAEDEGGRVSHDAWNVLEAEIAKQTSFAIGPGLGQSAGLAALVGRLFSSVKCPAVFDADALNLLASARAALSAQTPTGRSRAARVNAASRRVLATRPDRDGHGSREPRIPSQGIRRRASLGARPEGAQDGHYRWSASGDQFHG